MMSFIKKVAIVKKIEEKLSGRKGALLVALSFFLVAFYIFRDFHQIYFLQDEWLITGRLIYNINTYGALGFFTVAGTHFIPLASIFWYLQYTLFGLNSTYYAYMAVVLHALASFTLFLFLKKLIKSNFLSFIFSFLFLIHFNTTQSIIWLAVYYSYVPSFILALVFLMYFMRCGERGKITWKDGIILFAIILFALLFYETAILAILLMPVYWYLFWSKESKKNSFKPLILLFASVISFFSVRVLLELYAGEHVVYQQGNQLAMTVYNLATVPIKLLVQSIFSIFFLWDTARRYTHFAFPMFKDNGLMQETVVLESVIFVIFGIIIVLFVLLLNKVSKSNNFSKKILILGAFWFLFSAFVISLQSRYLYHMDYRYLYQSTIGILLIAFSFFSLIFAVFSNRKRLFSYVALLMLVVFTYSSVNLLRTRLPSYYEVSSTRKEIIKQILRFYPSIPKKTVFYVQCKNENDCLSNGLVLPFQSGVGQMLLVIYGSVNEKSYYPFMQGFYLWDWESEDYREINDYGFGYFRDLAKIKKIVRNELIKPEYVIAFSYDRSSNKIEDITQEIRKKIEKDVELPFEQ